MIWNVISAWLAVVLFAAIFIGPMFIKDDSDENVEAYADEMMLYSKICLMGILICNIVAMFVN